MNVICPIYHRLQMTHLFSLFVIRGNIHSRSTFLTPSLPNSQTKRLGLSNWPFCSEIIMIPVRRGDINHSIIKLKFHLPVKDPLRYCPSWGLGEKPSPSGKDFSMPARANPLVIPRLKSEVFVIFKRDCSEKIYKSLILITKHKDG